MLTHIRTLLPFGLAAALIAGVNAVLPMAFAAPGTGQEPLDPGIAPVALAGRRLTPSLVPVDVDFPHGRLPRGIEFLVHNVVAEALANAAKHSVATVMAIRSVRGDSVRCDDMLDLAVSDDRTGVSM